MAPKRRAKKQTQEASSCVFGDRTERLTNSHFLFSYAAKFKLIINNLTYEGVKTVFYDPTLQEEHYTTAIPILDAD